MDLRLKLPDIYLVITCILMGLIIVVVSVPKPHPAQALNTESSELSSGPAPIIFKEQTIERGIQFMHTQSSDIISGLDETLGSGACVFDMDNDHDMDIYLVGGSGQRRFYGKKAWWARTTTGRLFENQGDGTFEDITEQSNLAIELWGMGCNTADFDLDGNIDLFVTARNHNLLFKNLGDGNFAKQEFDKATKWSTSASIGDYNNDGKMDIYVSNYLRYDNASSSFESLSGYEDLNPQFRPQNYSGDSNYLFTNLGQFLFRDDTVALKVGNLDGRTLSAKWFDANDDEWLDLLVLNDVGSPSQLYFNIEGKFFEKASLNKQLNLPVGIRDAAIYDFDKDGSADFAFSTQLGEELVLLKKQGEYYLNTLRRDHENSEEFNSSSGFGIQSVDLNNDGEADIFHGHGLAMPDPDAAAISLGQPDAISLSNGNGQFSLAHTKNDKLLGAPLSTRSVIAVDIDNDGDKDVLLTNNNNSPSLLVNKSPIPSWVGFELIDQNGNRGNFSKMVIKTDLNTHTFFPNSNAFLGNSDHRISLAIAEKEMIKNLTIYWRDGQKVSLSYAPENQYNIIRQNSKKIFSYGGNVVKKPVLLPAKLALWQIKTGRFIPSEIATIFNQLTVEQQLELIAAITLHDTRNRLLSILSAALNSDESVLVIESIKALQKLELEISYFWLAALFTHEDTQVLCALTNAFKHFFIEEEAMIRRKELAIPHLVRLLDQSSPEVATCAILALAESKSVRAVVPIERLLLSSEHRPILVAATHALRELRYTRSEETISSYASQDQYVSSVSEEGMQNPYYSDVPLVEALDSKDAKRSKEIIEDCPKTDPSFLADINSDTLALLFSSCSYEQIKLWFNQNREVVGANKEIFVSSDWLDDSSFAIMIEHINQSKDSGTTRLFLLKLQQNIKLENRLVLIKALQTRMPFLAIEKYFKRLLADNTQPKSIRIAAGDALVDYLPEYVMSFSPEIFDEYFVTR